MPVFNPQEAGSNPAPSPLSEAQGPRLTNTNTSQGVAVPDAELVPAEGRPHGADRLPLPSPRRWWAKIAWLAVFGLVIALAGWSRDVLGAELSIDTSTTRTLRSQLEALRNELNAERAKAAAVEVALREQMHGIRDDKRNLSDQLQAAIERAESTKSALELLRIQATIGPPTNPNGPVSARLEAELESARKELGGKLGDLTELTEKNRRLQGDLEAANQQLVKFGDVNGVYLDALHRFTETPRTGWVIYGERCLSKTGWDGRHPKMHNRNFEADRVPSVGDVARVREFTNVWAAEPKRSDEDKHSFIVTSYKEVYPPEAVIGILIPGQAVRVVQVMDIEYAYTYIQYELLPEAR